MNSSKVEKVAVWLLVALVAYGVAKNVVVAGGSREGEIGTGEASGRNWKR